MSVHVPPTLLHLAVAAAAALLSHFLHLPSLLLFALHTYIHPDAVPSSTPRAVLRPPNSATTSSSSKRPAAAAASAFDASSAQLFRLRLSHPALSSRPHFPTYHFSLLLPLALLPASLLLPASPLSLLSPLLPLFFLLLSLPPLLFPTSRPSHLAAALAALLLCTLLSSSPFAGALASLAVLPAARFARAFWLGTDQVRSGLAVLSSSSPSRFLLHLAVLASAAAAILQCCGFLDGHEREELLLATAAGAQLLAVRAGVQMYLNEAVFCWYQRLHSSRTPDTDYGRAKVFLHNHHLCGVAVQLLAPPLLVLSLLTLSRVPGEAFEGVPWLDALVGWSGALREAALLAARWVVASWAVVTVATLVCYRRGWLFVL